MTPAAGDANDAVALVEPDLLTGSALSAELGVHTIAVSQGSACVTASLVVRVGGRGDGGA